MRASFRGVLVPDIFDIQTAVLADGILAAIEGPGEVRDMV
jgi:hypothetical protein